MNLTDGQSLALKQVNEISEASSGGLTVKSISPPKVKPGWLQIRITYACEHLCKEGARGLPLHHRETFDLWVSTDFPFSPPTIKTTHLRFAGYPHVQWGKQICLYQAPSTEWVPSDGMYGFFSRLGWWLSQGAAGELDPVGAPLHPPITYTDGDTAPGIVPICNTPIVATKPWIGFAELGSNYPHFRELVGWRLDLPKENEPQVAPAFLLSEKMPIEFPERIGELISALETRGVSKMDIFFNFQLAFLQNLEDSPLIIVIGTPMRGISGNEVLLQHLSAWKIPVDSIGFKSLKLSLKMYSQTKELRELGQEGRSLFEDWANSPDARVEWLKVREARPEVTCTRDEQSALNWFKGKTVSIWGCGAVGSIAAEMLTRAGVQKLILKDQGTVAPGLLVRQQFDYEDIHKKKVDALKKRLIKINPQLAVDVNPGDIRSDLLSEGHWNDSSDLIIESTGSNSLLQKLELALQAKTSPKPPILSMAIGHQANFAVCYLVHEGFPGGPKDADRKIKIETSKKDKLKRFADEFWPEPQRAKVFQPEPGCSETTFSGSSSDVVGLTSRLLKLASTNLGKVSNETNAFLIHQGTKTHDAQETEILIPADLIFQDFNQRFEIRVAPSAWKDILAWKEKSRGKTPIPETGGILFGEYDEASRVFWITEACGPPPDSIASPSEFQCGIQGLKELQSYHRKQSRNSVQCVGLWHTHPNSTPLPSRIDIDGMKRVFSESGVSPRHSLLFIVGDLPVSPTVFSTVFSRGDSGLQGSPTVKNCQVMPQLQTSGAQNSIGLALSGGGSRAIAFHLGCLRALYHRGVLKQVKVISSISGGSVLAAAYAYSEGSFEDFEVLIRKILKRGLLRTATQKMILSPLAPKALATIITSGLLALFADILRLATTVLTIPTGKHGSKLRKTMSQFTPPFGRWWNRSDALEQALADILFGDKVINSKRRSELDIVINATELRTGTAFRFGSRESGSSRFKTVSPERAIKVSEAVAASACFPVFLPAFDRTFPFLRKDGVVKKQRVLLTDGGVYDNLGITPLLPDRTEGHGTNSYSVDYLISCSAGIGISNGSSIPYWWPFRMIQAFDTTFRRVQEGSMKILHNYVATGQLKGLVFSYLGQIDERLPAPPFDLVPREAVNAYPTSFSAMEEEDIDAISLRGEQLTRLLISRYCPEL